MEKEQNLLKQYHYKIGNQDFCVFDHPDMKLVRSKSYNYNFDKKTGYFQRWGATYEEDPQFSPIGAELVDIEITTICDGIKNKDGINRLCQFCYKSNTPKGINMSFDDFKKIFDSFPRTISQVAVGADSHATSNPDLFKMMHYCRDNGVIPNITVADISDETAEKLVEVCGAVAVSACSGNKEICYNSVKKLLDLVLRKEVIVRRKKINFFKFIFAHTFGWFWKRFSIIEEIVDQVKENDEYKYEKITLGELLNRKKISEEEKASIVRQKFSVNIHLLVSQENIEFVKEVLNDRLTDPRLQKMGAIVFLSVKNKGRAKGKYNSLNIEQFKELIDFCFEKGIVCGFDSCNCGRFEKVIKESNLDKSRIKQLLMASESCESTLFSIYINVLGEAYACSFCEGEEGQKKVSALNGDFLNTVWYAPEIKATREKIMATAVDGCRRCIAFPEINV